MNGSISISPLALLICVGLISLSTGDASVGSTVSLTVKEIERLYNEVLQTSLDDARTKLSHLNDSNAIDRQYFDELDKIVGTDSYYSSAYFIFALINSSLFDQSEPDQLLLQVLPSEKICIRNFFVKVRLELLKYFATRQQTTVELIRNVTRWQQATENSIVLAFLEFPQKLQDQVPELQLMDYMQQARGLVEGIAQALQATLPQ
ncbi:uncharacterized protein Hf [Drosophila virilis]|uniref:Uncharacterized protein n=1 Tax=Drosophila virilis TaxID=7244 RepID=B4LVF4_DROVI|nr:uncharacterized protein LOC6628230 [Drosophila virilis]EDW63333.1 uncharacterized protein Dvir_GJ14654 [Drosophila virilis]